MAVRLKSVKAFYVTEVSLDLPVNAKELDDVLRSIRATGRMTIQYNDGGVLGVSVETRTKLSESEAAEVRTLVGIPEKSF